MVRANGLEFGLLEAGTGPLALCLHGFPDSAYTWRHLLPALAEVGFHAVAPFLRGYAPTAVPDDACYGLGALVADAVALHQALDGDGDAVLIGHDWGAEAAYGAAAFAPDRWRRVVTLGVPPLALDPVLFGDYQQLKRFFYLFWFRDSLARAAEVVAADGMAFLDRLWRDWSPGYDAAEDLARVKESLCSPRTFRRRSATTATRRVLPRLAMPCRTRLRSTPPRCGAASRRCICMAAPTATSLWSWLVAPSRCSRPARA
jgi:pimeloyl-ACP methyl ester carboxylesterase